MEIYIYMGVSVYWPLSVLCVCVCMCVCVCVCVCVCPHMCDINSVYQGTKVPRLDMYRSILSLSKIAHQMRHDHPFSQKKHDNRKSSGDGVWRYQGSGEHSWNTPPLPRPPLLIKWVVGLSKHWVTGGYRIFC